MVETPKDPLAVWRDMLAEWEKGLNAAANQAMGSEEFTRSVHRATQASAQVQQSVTELVARYLTVMNLPGKGDFAELAARLRGIEDGVNRIAAALERAQGAPPAPSAAPRPARTRRPAKARPA